MLHALLALSAFASLPDQEILFTGTGPYKRPIVTQSVKARQFFDQGLNFLYAFNHGEAKRSFRAAAKYDPNCAMAWWGLAMANGPHINNMSVEPDEEKEAVESLKKAMANIKSARPADQALIRATLVRFKDPQPKDRNPLNAAFANAMRGAWKLYPSDPDVGALFAESMMDLRPWDLWKHDGTAQPGTLEIVSTLERVIKLNPMHPMGLHLYIHAVEASPNPGRAADEADKLRDLQPALGHNVHMPSHIDVRLGAWQKAIDANTKAIAADKAYRARRPQQFIYRIYMAHNHHMLAFAAMMLGKRELCISHIDQMIAEMPEDFRKQAAPLIDGFFSMPFEARVRFGMWDDVLAQPDLPEHFPISRALRHSARAVAYAAKGMTPEARLEQLAFDIAYNGVPKGSSFGNNTAEEILQIARHLMMGEILLAEKKLDASIAELKLAAKTEDSMRYDEPPDWIQPIRHTLGAALLEANRYSEAAEIYRQDLKRLPDNGWSLYGLSQCMEALGRTQDSARLRNRFKAVWAGADTQITSSCLCIPGK